MKLIINSQDNHEILLSLERDDDDPNCSYVKLIATDSRHSISKVLLEFHENGLIFRAPCAEIGGFKFTNDGQIIIE